MKTKQQRAQKKFAIKKNSNLHFKVKLLASQIENKIKHLEKYKIDVDSLKEDQNS